MTPLKQLPRLLGITAILVRYRLDELIDVAHLYRPLKMLRRWLPRAKVDVADLSRGARLRLALVALGPIFVKFGQILSTRRDLLPMDVADELALLQDQVAPFPGADAQALIEKALGAPIATLYQSFDPVPLASASIAQVHAARLHDGREVVVKVRRPNIASRIDADIQLLKAIAKLVGRYHPNADKIRPRDVVAEIENTLQNELDFQREGANASLLRRNFLHSEDLYVPEVHWLQSNESVLTMERVRGIAADDLAQLDAAGVNRVALAEKGVRLFYTQVFRDNFFHADAHPGNIWVDPTRKDNPRFIALDFGIMGTLSRPDLFWLGQNFKALFNQDYRRIAELHLEAGWVPSYVRADELETAVRTVCEPYFTRPLSQISLGEVILKLFSVARRYELTLQPQLILLQKTLLNIEGLGRQLHPHIDIFATAKPVLDQVLRQRYSLRRALKELRTRGPEWATAAMEMPQLLHTYIKKSVAGEIEVRLASSDLRKLAESSHNSQAILVPALLGVALLLAASALYIFDARGPHFAGQSALALLTALGGLFCFWRIWPKN